MTDALRIWHVGNWCIHTGNEYIESPFLSAKKNVEVLNYGQSLVTAMRAIDDAEVISQPSWELYNLSPEDFDQRLEWATTIVFGDVETKCMMLHPVLGFNETRKRDDCETIAEIQFAGRWHPLLAARKFGKGRVTAWTTGASPHWATL